MSRSASNKFMSAIRAHTKFRMVFYNFYYRSTLGVFDYYGYPFAVNSSKQFWTRDTSKPWASAGWSKRAISSPW